MSARRERVILELETNFPLEAARAAAAIRLLNREVDGVDSHFRSSSKSIDDTTKSMDRSGSSLDRFTGRLSVMAQAAGALGPALVPIGAVGIPALTGLASS